MYVGSRLNPFHIDHIFMCQPPVSALMIQNVADATTTNMIKAGIVATANFTIKTTIEMKGILMSITTTLL
jgi:hypothetical protein